MGDAQALSSHEAVWRRYDEIESRLSAGLSERMLDLAALGPGMKVLDLASGRGEPALRAARRVAPGGVVWCVELAAPLLEMAREKAKRAGLDNLELRCGDAHTLVGVPRGHFDVVTARWGLMYLGAPVIALRAARATLAPGGCLVAALWAEPERVPYFTLPRRLLAPYRDVPAIDLEVPGTFRFASLDRIALDFTEAGFAIDHVEEMEVAAFESERIEKVVAWTRAFGLTPLLAQLSAADQRAWERDLADEMERRREAGVIRLGGVTRIVRARPITTDGDP